MKTLQQWLDAIGRPQNYAFPKTRELVKRYDCPDFDGELYLQANGIRPDGTVTFQRLFMAFPKNQTGKLPAVAVPFYYPEATLGFDPETGEKLPNYAANATVLDLVCRGYAVATADAYHLNYRESNRERTDFYRWADAAEQLQQDQPGWCGVGKLIADTKLVLDALEEDPRVDSSRMGIAGHSLGGKMAFYTGCLDERVKVMLCSDFGFGWDQTNWDDTWYWGTKLKELKEQGFDHTSLLQAAAPKPFCLLAGQYDNEESRRMILAAPFYSEHPERAFVVNHATGHRPPQYAKDAGYGFLDQWLKNDAE